MPSVIARVLKTSSAQTTATTGDWVTFPYVGPVSIVVNVTAYSGTSPTFAVRFEGRHDTSQASTPAIVNYSGTTLSTGTISTVDGRAVILPAGFRQIRYRSSFGGTSPSFTYSITARQAG